MRIAKFILRRLARLVVSLFAVSVIAFGLLQLAPGDFASIEAVGGGEVSLDGGSVLAQAATENTRRYGGDTPPWLQYARFMKGFLTFDIGPSYKFPHRTVEDIILGAFPVSATLGLSATLLALLVAVPLGALAAVKRGGILDTGTMFLATLGHGIPNYLGALVLVLIFSAQLHWLPSYGWAGPKSMILPVVALAVSPIAMLSRYVRNSMLENLREEYVVAALARGGNKVTVLIRHVLRNSLMPLITVTGPMLAHLVTGTVFLEKLLGIPGLGQYFTEAAVSRDMPLLMATTLFFATVIIVMNLLVDLSYAAIDPRVRVELGLAGAPSRDAEDRSEAPDVDDTPAESPSAVAAVQMEVR